MMVPSVVLVLFNTSALTPVLFSAMTSQQRILLKGTSYYESSCPTATLPVFQVNKLNIIYTRSPCWFVFFRRLIGTCLQKIGGSPYTLPSLIHSLGFTAMEENIQD